MYHECVRYTWTIIFLTRFNDNDIVQSYKRIPLPSNRKEVMGRPRALHERWGVNEFNWSKQKPDPHLTITPPIDNLVPSPQFQQLNHTISSNMSETGPVLSEVLPKSGLVFSEKGCLTYVLCKPKIMPIKSITLQKLEEMEKKAAELGRVDIDEHTINQVESATANNLEKIKKAADKAEQGSSSSFGGSSKSDSSSFPPVTGQTEGKKDSADVWKAE